MVQILPTYSGSLSDAERALVAGYVLHVRGQILRGLEVAREPALSPQAWWTSGMEIHFSSWEACTRYLLWLLGYPVIKDQQYPEFSDVDNQTAGIIRDVIARGWTFDPGQDG